MSTIRTLGLQPAGHGQACNSVVCHVQFQLRERLAQQQPDQVLVVNRILDQQHPPCMGRPGQARLARRSGCRVRPRFANAGASAGTPALH
jgi:hypothetical protein